MTQYPGDRFGSDVYQFGFKSNLGVIETHQHLSEEAVEDRTFGWGNNGIDAIMRAMDHCGVEASILQPLGGAHDVFAVHRKIYEYSQKYPGRIFGIASLNVKECGEERAAKEFEHCVKELKFVGLKFHGFSHGINPASPLASVYFESARSLGVPLMVCVGAHGQPFTNPGLFAERAAMYPDLTIIFAHMDYAIAETAISLAGRLPNIYLSSSLSITAYLERAITRLGPERMMLASEDAAGMPAEIAKLVFATHNDSELRVVLRETALDVFNLRGRLRSPA